MKTIIEQLQDLKRLSHRAYIDTMIGIINSVDLSGIDLEDWQIVVLQEKLTELRNKLWLPKAVNLNIQKYFEVKLD